MRVTMTIRSVTKSRYRVTKKLKNKVNHCCCGEELDQFCCSDSFIHKYLRYIYSLSHLDIMAVTGSV